jgi:hypothetical protein
MHLITPTQHHKHICSLAEVLQQQITSLPVLCDAINSAISLCPPCSALGHTAVTRALARANAALSGIRAPLVATRAAVDAAVAATPVDSAAPCTPKPPLIFTQRLVAAMEAAAGTLAAAAADAAACGSEKIDGLDAPEIEGPLTIRQLHPAWAPLQRALDAARDAARLPEPDDTEPSSSTELSATLPDAIEASLRAVLLWSQGPRVDAPAAMPSLTTCTYRLAALLTTPILSTLRANLEAAARPAATSLSPPLRAQLTTLLSMVDILLAGVWAAAMHVVCMHAACTQLSVLSAATFVAYLKDGFGSGEAEEDEDNDGDGGEGEGASSRDT